MLIIFTVNDQKVTHDLGQRTLVAGSSGVVKAAFTFDNSWDGLDVVVVFSNSGKKCNNKPNGRSDTRWLYGGQSESLRRIKMSPEGVRSSEKPKARPLDRIVETATPMC